MKLAISKKLLIAVFGIFFFSIASIFIFKDKILHAIQVVEAYPSAPETFECYGVPWMLAKSCAGVEGRGYACIHTGDTPSGAPSYLRSDTFDLVTPTKPVYTCHKKDIFHYTIDLLTPRMPFM